MLANQRISYSRVIERPYVSDKKAIAILAQAKKNGSNMSVVIKMLLQEQVENEEIAQDLNKIK